MDVVKRKMEDLPDVIIKPNSLKNMCHYCSEISGSVRISRVFLRIQTKAESNEEKKNVGWRKIWVWWLIVIV